MEDWHLKKYYRNWNLGNQQQLDKKIWNFEQCVASRNHVYIQKSLRWHNNKDVVTTLEAMKKMVDFYHNKKMTY